MDLCIELFTELQWAMCCKTDTFGSEHSSILHALSDLSSMCIYTCGRGMFEREFSMA